MIEQCQAAVLNSTAKVSSVLLVDKRQHGEQANDQHLAFQYKRPDSNLVFTTKSVRSGAYQVRLAAVSLQLLSLQRSVHCHDADPPRRFPGATGLASWFSPWLPLYPVLSRDLFHDRGLCHSSRTCSSQFRSACCTRLYLGVHLLKYLNSIGEIPLHVLFIDYRLRNLHHRMSRLQLQLDL